MSDEPKPGAIPPPPPPPTAAPFPVDGLPSAPQTQGTRPPMTGPKQRPTDPKSSGGLVKIIIGGVILLLIGYLAFTLLRPRAPRSAATEVVQPAPAKPVSPVVPDKMPEVAPAASPTPDPALAEKNAASNSDPQASDLTPQAPVPQPAVVAPVAADGPERIELGGNIVIARASPAGAPRASAAFFFWAVNLSVSGITSGKPARMLLNNRLVYEGDVVNRSLGITFAQLDAANQLLVFRDATGATVTRSY